MMPDCTFARTGIDITPEILFDARNNREDLKQYFESCFDFLDAQTSSLPYPFIAGGLSTEDIEKAVVMLRGDFRFAPALSTEFGRIEEQLVSLTTEQYVVMQGFSGFKRLLVCGGAGTGKTLLALEQCRRYLAEGKKTLYLCYNRTIASFIRESTAGEEFRFDVYNLHGLMMKFTGESPDESDTYFSQKLPEKFLEYTGSGKWGTDNQYDAVVIDEGQDLMTSAYYMCINEMIRGGFKAGTWAVYFDENQNLYNPNPEYHEILTQLQHDSMPPYNLSFNLRNTRQIADCNYYHTNIPKPSQSRTDGFDVERHPYRDLADERRQLIKTVRKLRTDGIMLSDIVLISPYRADSEKSCMRKISIPPDIGQLRINPTHDFRDPRYLDFFTIYSFKGLESQVVIMLDVDSFEDDKRRLLNYVGISRAKVMLYLFYPEDKEDERNYMVLQGIGNQSH